MRCPICKQGSLDNTDNLFFCEDCGSTFILEYFGYTEAGASDTLEEGFEPKEFLDKYGKAITKFRNGT